MYFARRDADFCAHAKLATIRKLRRCVVQQNSAVQIVQELLNRSFFFSATTAGGALGTLLTGTVGSYVNENYGWPAVFYTIGETFLIS